VLLLFDVHWFARLGYGTNEICLAAQEGWRLKNVDHGSHCRNMVFCVHIGEDGYMQFAFDFGQYF
jgi:hypothetical protein